MPIINLIGRAVEAGLDFYLDACNARPDAHYQQLSMLAKTTGHDPNYLGLLARALSHGKSYPLVCGSPPFSSRLFGLQEVLRLLQADGENDLSVRIPCTQMNATTEKKAAELMTSPFLLDTIPTLIYCSQC